MLRKFSFALMATLITTLSLPSLVWAATPVAHVSFTTDAPCAVTVIVTSYTDPAGNQSGMPSGSTPWTLDTMPSTSVTFVYPKSATCNSVVYVWQSTTPGDPITSGVDGSTTTVTGHYVIDNTAPTLHLPGDITVEATGAAGAVITYAATADDANPVHPTVTCLPASGATFALGLTTVNCSATDAAGNTANGSFKVTVQDTTAPALSLPTDITTTATISSGIAVNFTASAHDVVDGSVAVTCQPASGSTFVVGSTTVNCSATDAHNNTANGSFTVTVTFTDNTPPAWTVPSDFSVEATGPSGAVVTYNASATDIDDAVSSQACSPASGSTFALGTTTVNCSATDTHGNTGTASFHVTVVDTTAPTLNLPQNITVDTTDASGTTVSFTASATDLVNGSVPVTCEPASGSIFPIGQTTVNCSATDANKNTANGSFMITVTLSVITDIIPPVVTVPSDMTIEATGPSGAAVSFVASANDNLDGAIVPTCVPASGSTFPLGTTLVTCSATDAHNNTGTASFNITVVDTTAPALTLPSDMTVSATSSAGAVVNFTASATDLVDGSVPVNCLPASGSIFPLGITTVNCSATDAHGNAASGSFTVTVQSSPVDQCDDEDGHGKPTDDDCDDHGHDSNHCQPNENAILSPINSDGSSVFHAGRTVPVKFQVCNGENEDANNASEVVSSFRLIQIIDSQGTTTNMDQDMLADSGQGFHAGEHQWVFNLSTKNLAAGNTYVYLITLNDGSTIQFQFTLK